MVVLIDIKDIANAGKIDVTAYVAVTAAIINVIIQYVSAAVARILVIANVAALR